MQAANSQLLTALNSFRSIVKSPRNIQQEGKNSDLWKVDMFAEKANFLLSQYAVYISQNKTFIPSANWYEFQPFYVLYINVIKICTSIFYNRSICCGNIWHHFWTDVDVTA